MIRIPIILAAFAALHLAWPSAASAQSTDYDETILSRNGLWLQTVTNTEDGLYCDIYQVNSHGFFQLSSYGDDLTVYVSLEHTSIAEDGEYDLALNIDRKEWVLHDADTYYDEGSDTVNIFFTFSDNEVAARFLRQFASGRVVTLPADRTRDKRWSLSGSSASVKAFRDCLAMIAPTY